MKELFKILKENFFLNLFLLVFFFAPIWLSMLVANTEGKSYTGVIWVAGSVYIFTAILVGGGMWLSNYLEKK